MHQEFSISRLTASVAAAALLVCAGAASASTVTFGGSALSLVSTYSEAGFDFSGIGGSGDLYVGTTTSCGPTCADNGTPWMLSYGNAGWASTIVMKAADSSLFNLVSFDGAEAPFSGATNFAWAAAIMVTGVLSDDTTVSQSFTLDQLNDGQGGAADFQSFTASLSGAFKELRFSGVQGNGISFAIDNLNVVAASVPEPASLALVALAMLSLGATGRRVVASKR